jgi:competence ComEA-like helix-hairpin-helix protein
MKRWISWSVFGFAGTVLWVLVLLHYSAAFDTTASIPASAVVMDQEDGALMTDTVPGSVSGTSTDSARATVLKKSPDSSASGGCINVNTADSRLLQQLPGVGPVLAAGIVTHRTQNGSFKQARDLLKVKGIGDSRLRKINDRICF